MWLHQKPEFYNDMTKIIQTYSDLARALHVSPQLINSWRKRPGAPKDFDLPRWQEFLATSARLPARFSAKDRLVLGGLKIRLLRSQAEREERRNQTEAAETLNRVDVGFGLDRGIAQLFNSVNQIFLNQFPAQLAGLDELQIYRKMEGAIRQLESQTRQELEGMAKEKV